MGLNPFYSLHVTTTLQPHAVWANPMLRRARLSRLRPQAEGYGLRPLAQGSMLSVFFGGFFLPWFTSSADFFSFSFFQTILI
jgi:hypothetical protein